MMPGRGFALIDVDRDRGKAGIVLLNTRDGLPDRLRGLDGGGADDYLVKPFEVGCIALHVARLEAAAWGNDDVDLLAAKRKSIECGPECRRYRTVRLTLSMKTKPPLSSCTAHRRDEPAIRLVPTSTACPAASPKSSTTMPWASPSLPRFTHTRATTATSPLTRARFIIDLLEARSTG
jgi:hypothetical protein